MQISLSRVYFILYTFTVLYERDAFLHFVRPARAVRLTSALFTQCSANGVLAATDLAIVGDGSMNIPGGIPEDVRSPPFKGSFCARRTI